MSQGLQLPFWVLLAFSIRLLGLSLLIYFPFFPDKLCFLGGEWFSVVEVCIPCCGGPSSQLEPTNFIPLKIIKPC